VDDTGIEPVTPTVSTFSGERWLSWVDRDFVDYGEPHSSAEESHRCSIVPETLRSGHLPAQRQAHWTNGA
jgi:hypothetical protein